MITRKLENKFLKYMYEIHVKTHPHDMGNLEESALCLVHGLGSGIERIIPEILIKNYNGEPGLLKYRCLAVAKELQEKGYVRFLDGNEGYCLTETGYKRAARGWFRFYDSIEYLNKNPGIAIIVSGVAIIISIGSLIVSIVALIKNAH